MVLHVTVCYGCALSACKWSGVGGGSVCIGLLHPQHGMLQDTMIVRASYNNGVGYAIEFVLWWGAVCGRRESACCSADHERYLWHVVSHSLLTVNTVCLLHKNASVTITHSALLGAVCATRGTWCRMCLLLLLHAVSSCMHAAAVSARLSRLA